MHTLTRPQTWTVTTSRGSRVDGITCEKEARGAVHMLGIASAIGPDSWSVVDNFGHRFIAELRRAS
jgi:hypothetical protein